MKTGDLLPFVPIVVEKPVCKSCKTFVPECLVPVGAGAVELCWLCAHHVVEHEVCVDHAYTGTCKCTPEDIYPARVITARRQPTTLLGVPVGVFHHDPSPQEMLARDPDGWKRESSLSAAVRASMKVSADRVLNGAIVRTRQVPTQGYRSKPVKKDPT
jgi:hypothetical protein